MKVTKKILTKIIKDVKTFNNKDINFEVVPFKENNIIVLAAICFIKKDTSVARVIYTDKKNWYLECGGEYSWDNTKYNLNHIENSFNIIPSCSVFKRIDKQFSIDLFKNNNLKGTIFCPHTKELIHSLKLEQLEVLEELINSLPERSSNEKENLIKTNKNIDTTNKFKEKPIVIKDKSRQKESSNSNVKAIHKIPRKNNSELNIFLNKYVFSKCIISYINPSKISKLLTKSFAIQNNIEFLEYNLSELELFKRVQSIYLKKILKKKKLLIYITKYDDTNIENLFQYIDILYKIYDTNLQIIIPSIQSNYNSIIKYNNRIFINNEDIIKTIINIDVQLQVKKFCKLMETNFSDFSFETFMEKIVSKNEDITLVDYIRDLKYDFIDLSNIDIEEVKYEVILRKSFNLLN